MTKAQLEDMVQWATRLEKEMYAACLDDSQSWHYLDLMAAARKSMQIARERLIGAARRYREQEVVQDETIDGTIEYEACVLCGDAGNPKGFKCREVLKWEAAQREKGEDA